MAKPAWLFMAWLVVVPGAVWSQPVFLPWNALKVEYAFANFQAVDDERLLSVNLTF